MFRISHRLKLQKHSFDGVKDLRVIVARLNEWNNIIDDGELVNFKWPRNLIVIYFVSSYNVSVIEKSCR